MDMTELLKTGNGAEESLAVFKRRLTVAALELSNGNQCVAAGKLKVHRNTLARWLEELQINPREFRVRRLHRSVSA